MPSLHTAATFEVVAPQSVPIKTVCDVCIHSPGVFRIPVQFFLRRFLERFREARAGVVHQHVKPAKRADRPINGAADRIGVGGVRLDRERLPPPRSISLTTFAAASAPLI